MTNKVRWGLNNPHPLSQMKTELIWEGKYDEYGNRRAVDIAGCSMPLQKIETVDEPASRAAVQRSFYFDSHFLTYRFGYKRQRAFALFSMTKSGSKTCQATTSKGIGLIMI